MILEFDYVKEQLIGNAFGANSKPQTSSILMLLPTTGFTLKKAFKFYSHLGLVT